MGNKLGRRRPVVDEKYTRPQGLYQPRDVDYKKLRKLILDSKLAPCYPGDEDCAFDLEECPICLLYYPSLNRSRCCTKGVCTECFLQMKPPFSSLPTQCPFCKTSNYAVEYRGMRSKEEKGIEQVEEQRVIEAKIRMQRRELQDAEERMQRRQEISSSSRIMIPGELRCRDMSSSSRAEDNENISTQGSFAAPIFRQPSRFRQNREDLIDVDLEELMVMEAIWLSIQENDTQRNLACGDAIPSEPVLIDHHATPAIARLAETSSSPSGGLACSVAALAECQHINRDSINEAGTALNFDMLPESGRLQYGDERLDDGYGPYSSVEVPQDNGRGMHMVEEEWRVDHGSGVTEAGTSYARSDATGGVVLPLLNGIGDRLQPNNAGSILPETFEEQMMLAMAASLAEAQARRNGQDVAWP